MKQIVDEFRQHIHDSTEAATKETITLMNAATNDEVLQSGPAKRALGGRTATLLAWGGLENLHYQCSSAWRAYVVLIARSESYLGIGVRVEGLSR